MEVDIYTFLPNVLQKHLHDMMGNISVENDHFRKPKKFLAHGLMFLYEETYAIFLEILKREKRIEIYLENNFNKVSVLIEDESIVIWNKIKRDVDICDLIVEDTKENDGSLIWLV